MPAFNINDADSVKEYLKSLDTFHHFDEINVQHIVNHLQITIISNSKEVYREFHKVSDHRTNQIFLGDELYTRMNSLSAALDIQSRLADIKDISSSNIFFNPSWITVHSDSDCDRSSYEVRVFDREEEFKIFVKVTFAERNEEIYSERMYCTDGHLVDFSRLEELVEKFDELDSARTDK